MGEKICIYLDNCCFNRPFDDQSQLRIMLESEAKLAIQGNVRSGNYNLVWSYILDYENSKNPFRERREQIANWKQYAVLDIDETQELLKYAEKLLPLGIKVMDALHIACAISGSADYFLTTDDGILKKTRTFSSIKVTDPIGFVKEVFL